MLVQQGTLKRGCVLVSGVGWAKVRSLINEVNQTVKEATPSIPVLTTGWRELPEAGQNCFQVKFEIMQHGVLPPPPPPSLSFNPSSPPVYSKRIKFILVFF